MPTEKMMYSTRRTCRRRVAAPISTEKSSKACNNNTSKWWVKIQLTLPGTVLRRTSGCQQSIPVASFKCLRWCRSRIKRVRVPTSWMERRIRTFTQIFWDHCLPKCLRPLSKPSDSILEALSSIMDRHLKSPSLRKLIDSLSTSTKVLLFSAPNTQPARVSVLCKHSTGNQAKKVLASCQVTRQSTASSCSPMTWAKSVAFWTAAAYHPRRSPFLLLQTIRIP